MRGLAVATVSLTVLTVVSYALLKALPTWEIYAAGNRRRMGEWMEAQRTFRRDRKRVMFEAYVATREAAT